MKKQIVCIVLVLGLIIFLSVALVQINKKKSNKEYNSIEEYIDNKEKQEKEKIEEYVDLNDIPISIYTQKTGLLTRISETKERFVEKKDIKVYQIYPSSEESVSYSGRFGKLCGSRWLDIDPEHKIKQGFIISYELNDGSIINQKILNPSMTQTNYDYIEIYLYDDYAHRTDSWYSHIEENQFNENTYFTSIKITAGSKVKEISSPIKLKAFTYDTDDDFDIDGNYRGNSYFEVSICDLNSTCIE